MNCMLAKLYEKELEEAVLDGYISGSGDLYGEYMTAEEYAAFTSDQTANFRVSANSNTEY